MDPDVAMGFSVKSLFKRSVQSKPCDVKSGRESVEEEKAKGKPRREGYFARVAEQLGAHHGWLLHTGGKGRKEGGVGVERCAYTWPF